MKKLLALAFTVVLLNSCKKSSDDCTATMSKTVATPAEISYLQTYAASNHPAAVQHSSGMFYEIQTAGTGPNAGICNTVTVKYSLYEIPSNILVPGQPTGSVSFALAGLISAWQQGIPLVKAGGTIMLLVPPSLSYNDGIYRKFYIQLESVQ